MKGIFSYFIRNRVPMLGGTAWRLRRWNLPSRDVLVRIQGTQNQITINPRSYMGTHII